ncbi:probable WRKY transcription factor 63 [Miscanthus floridulus]|uniref:probable WRKY transcription factor 63 n=1 Tax=Miscanthus floridulus TaxID=154761 RepID=UPI003457D096
MTLSPPQPPPSSSPRHAAIQELRRGTQLAELLRQQVELIPEPNRRHAAVVNVGQISMAMESSLSILQSEMEHPFVSEVMAAPTAYSDGGTSRRDRNGPVPRTRRVRHRRGIAGAELPIKEILTEAPENDRFHWRKYGEKNILYAEYPRLYYKCGYSDDHKCPAKKYVQQQSNSYPPLFLVTLINEHTCDTLFRDNEPSSSSSGSQVLDFTKASLSPPLMAAASELKKDEEDSISVSVHRYSYSYDEY